MILIAMLFVFVLEWKPRNVSICSCLWAYKITHPALARIKNVGTMRNIVNTPAGLVAAQQPYNSKQINDISVTPANCYNFVLIIAWNKIVNCVTF